MTATLRTLLPLSALLALGCGGQKENCKAEDAAVWYADLDGDLHGDVNASTVACEAPQAHVATGYDCDDSDPTIGPDAHESCNGVDDNCNGVIDDNVATTDFYLDLDGDGWGDAYVKIQACAAPDGYSAQSGDCEDHADTAYPGAPELYDGLDNDCDGTVDEDTVAYDDDGDGYTELDGDCDDSAARANPDAIETANGIDDDCDGLIDEGTSAYDDDGDGQSEAEGDCDDEDPDTWMGAPEWCDGVDRDCDGVADSPDPSDGDLWFIDSDGDGYGSPDATTHACTQPKGYSALNTDCNDSSPLTYPDAEEIGDSADNDCDGTVDEGTLVYDDDGDGFAENDGDCNDADPTIYPDAPESCNLLDDDCNGTVDDSAVDAPTWYLDADNDGYGTNANTVVQCNGPKGYASMAGDCEDAIPNVNPGLPEVCNGFDDNCDDVIDDDAENRLQLYFDDDGDGYGDDATLITSCSVIAGMIRTGGDCNDSDPTINPDAAEICDGIDNDCSGAEDDDAVDALTFYVDDDGDGYGDDNMPWWLCTQPTGTSDLPGDCDDGDPAVNPDATEICDDLTDNDCDGTTNGCETVGTYTAAASLPFSIAKYEGPVASDKVGAAIGPAGDINDDLFGDVLLGTRNDDTAGTDAGAAYLIHGPGGDAVADGSLGAKLLGEASGDLAGTALIGVGDVNFDGINDVLIGAQGESTGGSGAGAAYLVSGAISGENSLALRTAKFIGENSGDSVGLEVSGAGNLNGDDYADLLLTAPGGDAAYLLYGPQTGEIDLGIADVKITGQANSELGIGAADAGDLDGDGLSDVIVGAEGYDHGGRNNSGAAYVFYGPVDGAGTLDATTDAGGSIIGEEAGDEVGRAVAGLGDTNDDGYDDLLVAGYLNGTAAPNAGSAYVVLGPLEGEHDLATGAEAILRGASSGDYAGRDVDGVDANGDGIGDALIGAYKESTNGSDAGAVYVVYGPLSGNIDLASADLTILGEAGGDQFGRRVNRAGDVDGDGLEDLLLAGYQHDGTDSDAGAVYILQGHGL